MKCIDELTSDLKKRISKNKYFKNVAILSGGAAVAQLIAVVASPILTRLYTPEEFGILAVFVALLATLSAASSLKYHLAVPLVDDHNDALHVLLLSFIINILYGILIGILSYFAYNYFFKFENLVRVAQYIWILPISVTALGIYESLKFWAIRQGHFKHIAKTKITQNAIMVGVQISLYPFGPIGLVLGDALGRSGGSVTLAKMAWSQIKRIPIVLSFQVLKKIAVRYKRFPLFSSGSGILNSLGLQLIPLLIAGVLGSAIAGLYTLTEKVAGIPMKMIGQSYSQVYYREAIRVVKVDIISLNKLYNKQTVILFFIGLVPVTIFMLLGKTGFEYIFGSQWGKSGLFIQILAPMLLAQFIVVPLSQTLNIIERQDIQLYWDILRFISIVTVFIVSNQLAMDAILTITLISIVMTIMYIVLFIITKLAINKYKYL